MHVIKREPKQDQTAGDSQNPCEKVFHNSSRDLQRKSAAVWKFSENRCRELCEVQHHRTRLLSYDQRAELTLMKAGDMLRGERLRANLLFHARRRDVFRAEE